MQDVTIRSFPQFLTFKMADEAFRTGDPLEQFAKRCQLQPGTGRSLVVGKSGSSVVLLVDSTVDETRKTSVPHFGQYL